MREKKLSDKADNIRSPIWKKIEERRRKREQLKRSVLILSSLIFISVLVLSVMYLVKESGLFSETAAFDAQMQFSSPIDEVTKQQAEGIAEDLCVGAGDVPLESFSLEEGQKGALMDINNQEVLFAQGMYDKIYPASITKIMTSILAIRSGKLDDTVTFTQENVTLEDGSQVCGFQAGDQVTLRDLLNCLLVYSGNDAASAIATYVGGTQENFVNMMNSYAVELGATGTHFTNPHGLQDEDHYTTPYDIYLMLREALNYSEFVEIIPLSSYTVTYLHADGTEATAYLTATDHYLTGEANPPKGVTVLGGKTGTTAAAGNCLALLSQNAYGNPYVSIITGAATKEILYEQMNELLQFINSTSENR